MNRKKARTRTGVKRIDFFYLGQGQLGVKVDQFSEVANIGVGEIPEKLPDVSAQVVVSPSG